MLFTFLTLSAHASAPLVGLQYAPSRSPALNTSLQTGTGLGEFDGTVNPVWRPFLGLQMTEKIDLTTTLGVASHAEYTQIDEEEEKIIARVFRPALAIGFKNGRVEPGAIRAHYKVGVHANLPWVRRGSSTYSDDEQAAADLSSSVEADRLRGFGFDGAIGMQYGLSKHLVAGISWIFESHIGIERTTADVTQHIHSTTGGAFYILLK